MRFADPSGLSPEEARRAAEGGPEGSCEALVTVEARVERDVENGPVRRQQLGCRALQPDAAAELLRRLADALSEGALQMELRATVERGELIEARRPMVLVDESRE
ncbi:MAG: hypothetical protein AAGA81_00485 [Acidobacteriota bacterium]